MTARHLLAVDLGLKTGLAVFDAAGRVRRYRSQNFGARQRLKRGAPGVLADVEGLRWVVVEGDAALARVWARAAERMGAEALEVSPERWRETLLHPSERRDGPTAKRSADRLARAVIEWSGADRPTALRHDAAEAVCIGLWGVLAVGWLESLPSELALGRRGA